MVRPSVPLCVARQDLPRLHIRELHRDGSGTRTEQEHRLLYMLLPQRARHKQAAERMVSKLNRRDDSPLLSTAALTMRDGCQAQLRRS